MATTKIKIPIHGGWAPDLEYDNAMSQGFLKTCHNVRPINGRYYPLSAPQQYVPGTYSGTACGSISYRKAADTTMNVLGTSTKIYEWNKNGFTEITRQSAVAYNAASWNFAIYGDWLIATDYNDDIQVYKPGVGTFEPLTGTTSPAIKASFCLMNHTHLVLGRVNEGGTLSSKKVRWSARDNVESWAASLSTGAGSQNLPDMKGNITGLASVGDAFGVFCEHSITLGYYIGGQLTFGFKINQIQDVGCYYPNSLISTGTVCFFWSRDNIYMYDGSNIKAIGDNVRTTVFQHLAQVNTTAIRSVHDKMNGLIIWSYPTGSSSYNNRLLIYNYKENKFASGLSDSDVLGAGWIGGYLIDDINTPINDINILIDSPYWQNGAEVLYAARSGVLSTFTGAQQIAELETGEIADEDKVFTMIRAYAPVYTSSTINTNTTLTPSHRYDKASSFTNDTEVPIRVGRNFFDIRCTGKRIKLILKAAQFETIGGVFEAELAQSGRR